ncbi:MAG: GtrA family protein [bacterium]
MKALYRQHKDKINYLLVGAWNTLFGYCVFLLLYFLFAAKIHYLFLLVFSNILAITNAYIGYKIFVFRTKGNYLKEYLRFYVVYGAAMILNMIILPFVVELFKLSPPIAQTGLMLINIIFSYLGHKYFSFEQSAIKKSTTGI